MKLWALYDSSTFYVWQLIIYTGKQGNTKEINQGKNVVKKLIKDIENSGRNVTCDNFFTSLNLETYLLSKKLRVKNNP